MSSHASHNAIIGECISGLLSAATVMLAERAKIDASVTIVIHDADSKALHQITNASTADAAKLLRAAMLATEGIAIQEALQKKDGFLEEFNDAYLATLAQSDKMMRTACVLSALTIPRADIFKRILADYSICLEKLHACMRQLTGETYPDPYPQPAKQDLAILTTLQDALAAEQHKDRTPPPHNN